MYFPLRNPLAQMEEERREHDLKVKKMEAEMEQVFDMKVKEKKNKLKESEADVRYTNSPSDLGLHYSLTNESAEYIFLV